MNAEDDEWGEHRLIEALRNSGGSCPPAVVDSIFAEADTFAAGAPQHDDMTLVVFRVVEPGPPPG
jgi:sigma-B regulation protein RsbU (phosphoserine phosphatase)